MDATNSKLFFPGTNQTQSKLSQSLSGRISFYGTLTIFAFSAIPFGTVDPWLINICAGAICVFGLLRLVDGILSKKPFFAQAGVFIPLILLLIFGMFQIFTVSSAPVETNRAMIRFAAYLIGAEVLLHYADNLEKLKQIAYTVVLIGLGSALFALVRMSFPIELKRLPDAVGFGQFINRNHFAFLTEMVLGLMIGFTFAGRHNSVQRLFGLLFTSLLFVLLITSQSRGAVLALAALGFSGLILYPVKRDSSVVERKQTGFMSYTAKVFGRRVISVSLLLVLFALVLPVAVAFIGGEQVVSRIEQTSDEFQTKVEGQVRRADFWQSTSVLIIEKPFAGSGFAAYSTAITAFDRSSGREVLQQAHNDYLELAAGGGLFAVSLILIFLYIFFRRSFKNLHSADPLRRLLCYGALIGIMTALIHSFADFGLHTTVNAFVFIMLSVLALGNIESFNSGEAQNSSARPQFLPAAGKRYFFYKLSLPIIFCGVLFFAVSSFRGAVSLYFSDLAFTSQNTVYADIALRWDKNNYEAFLARAQTSFLNNKFEQAESDFADAIALNPSDYLLRLQLAGVYLRQNKFEAAHEAAQKSIELAPFYAAPNWVKGNIYLRENNVQRAFLYLNRAANRDLRLYPELITLANIHYFNDPAIDRAVTPESHKAETIAADYFIEQNIRSEKLEKFITGSGVSDYEKDRFTEKLLRRFNFSLAQKVWKSKKANELLINDDRNLLYNGDFNAGLPIAEKSFGWRTNPNQSGVKVSRIAGENGRESFLRVDFKGNSAPEELFLTQLVPVEGGQKYRLEFYAEINDDFVSGGLPLVAVSDPLTGKILKTSETLKVTTKNRQFFSIEFITSAETRALTIGLRRTSCSSQPCPAFGTVYFDKFVLSKIQTNDLSSAEREKKRQAA